MSITYTANTAATTIRASYRAFGPDGFGNFTYQTRRAYLRFDLSGAGISPGSIETAQLILRCTTVVGSGGGMQLWSAADPDGFGTTLDSTDTDFASTNVNTEEIVSVTATGTYTWNIDPDNIEATSLTYFRITFVDEFETAPMNDGALFASINNGTPANRPILRLTLFTGQVIFINQA